MQILTKLNIQQRFTIHHKYMKTLQNLTLKKELFCIPKKVIEFCYTIKKVLQSYNGNMKTTLKNILQIVIECNCN
jgi:hypothetical protein